MPTSFQSPEIVTREVSSGGVAPPNIATSIPFFGGSALRGPVNRPQFVLGIEDFTSIYGGDDGGDLYQSLVGFFDNGGERCLVNRVMHYTDITDASTIDGDLATYALLTTATPTLSVTATSQGTWGNSISVTTERVDRIVGEVLIDAAAGAITSLEIDSAAQIRVGNTLYIEDVTSGGEVRVIVSEILPGIGANGGDVIRFASATVSVGGLVAANNPTVTKETFNLTVLLNGVVQPGHVYRDLSMSPLDLKRGVEYVIGTDPTLLDPRQLIYVTNSDVAASSTVDPRPTDITSALLSLGTNGGALVDADYVGSSASHVGLRAADYLTQFAMSAIPGVETSAVHNALNDYAADRKDHVAFMDAPEAMAPAAVTAYKNVTANLAGTYGAMFVPRVRVLRQSTGVIEDFPAVGYVVGRFAGNDRERNVSEAAAGVSKGRLRGVLGVSRNNEYSVKGNRDIVYVEGINPIFAKDGRGVVIWGQNTLDPTDEFGALGVRRAFIFLARQIATASEFVLFEKNTPTLRNAWKSSMRAILRNARKSEILTGKTDAEAFFITCDRANNPESVVQARGFYGRVGARILPGIEMAIIEIEQDRRLSTAELAASAA